MKKHFLLPKNSLQNCFVGKRNISAKSFSTFTSKKTAKLCTKTQNQTKLHRFYFEQNPSKWSEFCWWKCGKTSSGLQENGEKLILFSVCRISMQRVYLLSYLSDFLINNCEMTCNLIKKPVRRRRERKTNALQIKTSWVLEIFQKIVFLPSKKFNQRLKVRRKRCRRFTALQKSRKIHPESMKSETVKSFPVNIRSKREGEGLSLRSHR